MTQIMWTLQFKKPDRKGQISYVVLDLGKIPLFARKSKAIEECDWDERPVKVLVTIEEIKG